MRSISAVPIAAAILAVAALSIRAQQAPPAQPQPPVTFKVDVNYVEIDAVVTDERGGFVGDLTRDDFEIIEEGQPQVVSAFSLVNLPLESPDPPLFRGAVIEPDVRSNSTEFSGRVFILVLDNLHTAPLRSARVKVVARQFIERYIGANDLVAIVHTGASGDGNQELTGSRARMLRGVDRFIGQKFDDETPMERQSRTRNTLETLKSIAAYLEPIRGRRKAIVWFSEGVDYEAENPLDSDSVSRDLMRDAIASATRAGVSFYGVDPRGLGAGLDDIADIVGVPDITDPNAGPTGIFDKVRRTQNSLRTISTETGGFAIVNQTDMRAAFARLVQDNSSYYLLGYSSSNSKRDGRFRNVQVRVKRPGLKVQARKGYTAPSGRATAATSTAPTGASPELREALNGPLPATGLSMRVFAAPFVGNGKNASLAIVAEFDPGELTFTEKDGTFSEDLELIAIALDGKGQQRDGGRDEAPMRLSAKSHAAVMQGGLRLTRRLEVPPGRYQVRVAARESVGGSVGAVTLDLDVPDFAKAPLSMSGLALTSPTASRMITANPDPHFKDVLPASPTARREFPRSDMLSLFVEVYDNQRAAHRVAIDTTVTSDDGRVVFTLSDERRSEDLGAKGGAYAHTAAIPLAEFAPGRYVLSVQARTLLSGGATAAREVEFRVR